MSLLFLPALYDNFTEDMMGDKHENMTAIDDDGENDHAWGVPVRDHNLANLSDEEYLTTILGPRRMGYQVFFFL